MPFDQKDINQDGEITSERTENSKLYYEGEGVYKRNGGGFRLILFFTRFCRKHIGRRNGNHQRGRKSAVLSLYYKRRRKTYENRKKEQVEKVVGRHSCGHADESSAWPQECRPTTFSTCSFFLFS
jgi:hypothetical protein